MGDRIRNLRYIPGNLAGYYSYKRNHCGRVRAAGFAMAEVLFDFFPATFAAYWWWLNKTGRV